MASHTHFKPIYSNQMYGWEENAELTSDNSRTSCLHVWITDFCFMGVSRCLNPLACLLWRGGNLSVKTCWTSGLQVISLSSSSKPFPDISCPLHSVGSIKCGTTVFFNGTQWHHAFELERRRLQVKRVTFPGVAFKWINHKEVRKWISDGGSKTLWFQILTVDVSDQWNLSWSVGSISKHLENNPESDNKNPS